MTAGDATEWMLKPPYLCSQYPELHDAFVLLLSHSFCGELQPTNQVDLPSFLHFGVLSAKAPTSEGSSLAVFFHHLYTKTSRKERDCLFSSHERKLLVDVEQRSFCKIFGRRHNRVVGQHLPFEFGEGHQRLGDSKRQASLRSCSIYKHQSLPQISGSFFGLPRGCVAARRPAARWPASGSRS